jgi:hypothetical protein
VSVPPALVLAMPPPARICPVLDTLTLTFVAFCVAVMATYAPKGGVAVRPPWPVTR